MTNIVTQVCYDFVNQLSAGSPARNCLILILTLSVGLLIFRIFRRIAWQIINDRH